MFANVVEARGRVGTTLATQFDADGKELKFDIREDELQSEKLQETIELLVAAGYFRARIKGLSAFDKVVGGMVWCISFCDFDVDVDLLYQENFTIGQKISLTEKIVRVLSKMKCPFAIEPHQIQGLDFVHIFPVMQWLVRKAIEARQEMGDSLQIFASHLFDKEYKLTSDDSVFNENVTLSSGSLHDDLKNLTLPQRIYKRNNPDELKEEASRVQSTILEYAGSGFNLASKQQNEKGKENASQVQQDDVGTLMTGMSKVNDSRVKLSAATISSVMDTENIQKIARDYAFDLPNRHQATTIVDSIESLTEQKAELLSAKTELENDLMRIKSAYDEEKQKYLHLKGLEDEVKAEFENLNAIETAADEQEAELLKSLLAKRDESKKAEQDFKERCKKEAALIQAEIDRLQDQSSTTVDESDEAMRSIREEHSSVKIEFGEIRLDLAALNREIAVIQRKLDDEPSRAELNQYQRRFMELYNQIASTHKETKKFYTMFNTLQDVKMCMEKEATLLNSVYDNYETALSSEQNKLQFVRQLEQTLEGVRQNKSRIEKRHTEEKMKRDAVRENYQEMLDKQRLYYKTVKDFQEECKKNETLHARLAEMGLE